MDVVIPRDQLTVITGLSGSGKSSLAFDTIYAEGQRRYVESLSAYARQFLELMGKPDVDSIEGLSPAISIEQKTTSRNPRSTVGTVTEIHDYMRLLWARAGVPYSPATGLPIEAQTVSQMVDRVMAMPEGTRLLLLAPVVRDRKGEYRKELAELQRRGFTRVKVDGTLYEIGEVPSLNRKIKHEIEAVVDRIVVRDGIAPRLADSFETALALSDGVVYAENADTAANARCSRRASPARCRASRSRRSSRGCSASTRPHGACPACDGLGVESFFDPALVVPDERLSLADGAIMPWTGAQSPYYDQTLQSLARHFKVTTQHALAGSAGEGPRRHPERHGRGAGRVHLQGWRARLHGDEAVRGRAAQPATPLAGDRQRLGARGAVALPGGKALCRLQRRAAEAARRWRCASAARTSPRHRSCRSARRSAWFGTVIDTLTPQRQEIARRILREIGERLQFLVDVGLDYLTLSRGSATLSGGESQRIRLASQIGSGLTGVLYVLDEPSIGLHQRDNERLLGTLRRLRDLGNTVLVVEHDEEAIRAADHLIDMGPAAGIDGGRVVAEGTPAEVSANPKSLTGDYLAGRRRIDVPVMRRPVQKDRVVRVVNARGNNLKSISAGFPLGTFTCVTGVSGGGKSTLVVDTLYKAAARRLMGVGRGARAARPHRGPGTARQDHRHRPVADRPHAALQSRHLHRPVRADPRLVRRTAGVRARGYKPGRFSFNVKGGRCEACQGDGVLKIEMHFLPDVYVTCDVCKGRRYNRETLEIKFRDKSIAEVLAMTVDEAVPYFSAQTRIHDRLRILQQVGLGYIALGQQATTLSGGEAQRIKLSKELARRATGRTLYILDEPTTGLHFEDVRKLLEVLHALVDQGNTVVVIEHNLEVIKTADWILDLGPEGGDGGGRIVAEGTPEDIAAQSRQPHRTVPVAAADARSDPAEGAAPGMNDAPRSSDPARSTG